MIVENQTVFFPLGVSNRVNPELPLELCGIQRTHGNRFYLGTFPEEPYQVRVWYSLIETQSLFSLMNIAVAYWATGCSHNKHMKIMAEFYDQFEKYPTVEFTITGWSFFLDGITGYGRTEKAAYRDWKRKYAKKLE